MDRRRFLQSGSLAALCGLSGYAQDRKVPHTRVLAVTGYPDDIQPPALKLKGMRSLTQLRLYQLKDGEVRKVWESPTEDDRAGGVYRAYLCPTIIDVDGDGKNELVTASRERITVWKAPEMTPYHLPITQSLGFPGLGVGDANNDGIQEIFAANMKMGVGVYAFDGRQFATIAVPMPIQYLQAPAQIQVFDVNHDGKPEVVIAGSVSGPDANYPGYVYIFSMEKGKLAEQTRLPTRTNINSSVRFADIDNDGARELVVSGRSYNRTKPFAGIIAWRYDQRTGKYEQTLEHDVGKHAPEAMDIGDVDGDGKNEVVIATSGVGAGDNMEAERYLLVLRHARGTFQTLYSEPSGVMAHFAGIAIGDLDPEARNGNEFSLQGADIYKHQGNTYARVPVPDMKNNQGYCCIGDLPTDTGAR